MRSVSSTGRSPRGEQSGKLSAAERSALNQALAKALAFKDARKMQEAQGWAAELVRLLRSHNLLTCRVSRCPSYQSLGSGFGVGAMCRSF